MQNGNEKPAASFDALDYRRPKVVTLRSLSPRQPMPHAPEANAARLRPIGVHEGIQWKGILIVVLIFLFLLMLGLLLPGT